MPQFTHMRKYSYASNGATIVAHAPCRADLAGGTIDLDGSSDFYLLGPLSGSGPLLVNNSGVLAIGLSTDTQGNAYTGAITVSKGYLGLIKGDSLSVGGPVNAIGSGNLQILRRSAANSHVTFNSTGDFSGFV